MNGALITNLISETPYLCERNEYTFMVHNNFLGRKRYILIKKKKLLMGLVNKSVSPFMPNFHSTFPDYG